MLHIAFTPLFPSLFKQHLFLQEFFIHYLFLEPTIFSTDQKGTVVVIQLFIFCKNIILIALT